MALLSVGVGGLSISAGTLNVATTSVASGVLTVNGPLNLSGGALTVNGGGELDLGGTLGQTGGTLTLNGGTIAGGTINSTAGTLNINSGTLSGTTFDGPLNLTSSSVRQSVHLANGATVVGSAGSGPGTINVTGYYCALFFDNTQTVSNETINLGNSQSYDSLYGYDPAGKGKQVLTLGASVTLNAVGSASISSGYGSGDGIVNQGVIDQTGGNLSIGGNALTNSGAIDAKGSGTLYIAPTTFTNSGAIDVANGDFGDHRSDDVYGDGVEPHYDRGEFVGRHPADQRLDQPRLDHAGERREPHPLRIDVGGEPGLDLELRRDN